jgi:hypothetical protein
MSKPRIIVAAVVALCAGLTSAGYFISAAQNLPVTADHGIAAGGDLTVKGSVTIGLTPEEVKKLALEIVRQESAAEAKVSQLSQKLDVTEPALKRFFSILKEQEVPTEQLAEHLAKIADRHKSLLAEVAAFRGEDDPEIANLTTQAEAAIKAGRYEAAKELLTRAKDADIAASRRHVEAAERRRLRAAEKAAALGNLANTRLDYAAAMAAFVEAADLVPESAPPVRAEYLNDSGLAAMSGGRYAAATPLLEEALEIRKREFGTEHLYTVTRACLQTQPG